MLERARSKSVGLPVRWVEADARKFDLHEQFRFIFLTGNAFQAFVTNAEQEALLAAGARYTYRTRGCLPSRHATRSSPTPALARVSSRVLETRLEAEDRPAFIDIDGHQVQESITQVYDHVTQILHLTAQKRWHGGKEEKTKITRTALRYTFPQELAALLRHNGFRHRPPVRGLEYQPLSAGSPSIISICRKRLDTE